MNSPPNAGCHERTLFLAGSADPNAGGESQGMFASLPDTTPKMLFEVQGGPHEIGDDPQNADGETSAALRRPAAEQRQQAWLGACEASEWPVTDPIALETRAPVRTHGARTRERAHRNP